MGGRGSGSGGITSRLSGKDSFNRMYGDTKKAENLTTEQLREGYNNSYINISEGKQQHYNFLVNYANKNGYQVKQEMGNGMPPTANGMVNVNSKTIYLNPQRTQSQQIKSLAHEIGHAKLHNNPQRQINTPRQEMEADAFAKMVTENFKMTNDSSKYYVEGWRQQDNIPTNYLNTNQQYLIDTYNDMFGY